MNMWHWGPWLMGMMGVGLDWMIHRYCVIEEVPRWGEDP